MYIPSDTPLLTDQRADAAIGGVCSDQRVQAMRRTSATGRAALFNTLVTPAMVAEDLGTGAALNTAIIQQQTETTRATGLLGTVVSQSGQSMADIIRDAPEVVPLNRGGGCQTTRIPPAVPIEPNPQPGMPQRAPTLVRTPQGPLNFVGAPSTVEGSYQSPAMPTQYYSIVSSGVSGLTGYAPPWSDAWVMQMAQNQVGSDVGVASWISNNPLWALLIAGAGIAVLSRRSKR